MVPSIQNGVMRRQEYMIDNRGGAARVDPFQVGDAVSAMNIAGAPKWLLRVLWEQLGPVSFEVQLVDG